MKRHRRTCEVWKNRDKKALSKQRRKETMLERHGVENCRHVEGAEEKRKQTCQKRYGAENPFAKESSVFDKVQESLEGKRPVLKGQDNPFAWETTKEKIRESMLANHGVANPQQSPEIRARTRETNLERYGVEEPLASPEMRERIRETCQEVYGGPAPSCSPEVQAKAQETNLERYGVPWTCMDPEVRRKQMETHFKRYGGVHFFASREGIRRIREGMLAKHGVDHPAKVDGFWERNVETFLERYGVAHPLQLIEFLEKRRETCQELYGVDSPLQSPEVMARLIATCRERYGSDHFFGSDIHMDQIEEIQAKIADTCQDRFGAPSFVGSEAYKEWSRKLYGTDHPMQNREYARKHLERMRRPGPNLFERRIAKMAPVMLYTGNGSWWRWLPDLGHHKNPDFIVPGPIKSNPKKHVTKVVECFGDFWHSRMFTGKAPFDHEQELIAAFRAIGIDCLVIWESEAKQDPCGVSQRLAAFLSGDSSSIPCSL
jgi:hypothetical protein